MGLGSIVFVSGYYFFPLINFGLLEKFSATLTYPLIRLQNIVAYPIRSIGRSTKRRRVLEAEMAHIMHERDQLLARVIELESMMQFEEDAEELIAFKKRFYQIQASCAQIIMRQFSRQGHYIFVDKGSFSGITTDMVAVYKNCLLGRVIQVYPGYSRVMLITHKECKVAAQCPKTGAHGIHEGFNNSDISALNFISHLQQVYDDDFVMSSGQGLIFPKGFALGRIKNVVPAGLYHRIEVEPVIDFATIEYCYLLDKGQL